MLQRNHESTNAPFSLFQREGTRNWSMRYSLGGKQIKKSLGIADHGLAMQRAHEIYHEQKYRHKQGLSLTQHAFHDVAEEFIEKVCAEAERGERSHYHPTFWPPIIRRFPVGYFGDKPIDLITTADVARYLEWRKTYWTRGPGSQIEKIRCKREDGRVFARPAPRKIAALTTMKGEMVIIRELFRQAALWGYCKPLELPTVETRKRPDNRRPGFKPEEYEKLIAKSIERINEHHTSLKVIKAKDGRVWTQKAVTENIRADRVRLHAYIELMANSGLRPTEAKNLTWGDISLYRETRKLPLHKQDARLAVRGKGKHGNTVPLYGAVSALEMLWNLFEHDLGREPQDDDPVFADETGKPILSFKKGLNALLIAAGLEKDNRGVRRTSYSFRHFYISQMLANNVSVHHVARNTRTSLAMIDKHYAQVNTEQIKDFLRPGQEDFSKEPVLLDEDTFDEIKLLEKRIEELKRGGKGNSIEQKIAQRYAQKLSG
ncbi:site-specific integrase [Rhizobium sp. Leaf311]|uniref:tyrosine-type recombinase/integrase n=1 Tax=Rhizobium sp. Leaf311 TaxID=1736332 RepID=UPI0009E674B0|nr:site-specific integrase [Rhizobium sp. Leaf311]